MGTSHQHRKHTTTHGFTPTPASRLKLRTAIQRSLATTTLHSYQSTVRLFHAFCDREGVPTKARTPASEMLLCIFAADGLDRLSGSTTRNRMAALKAWHSFNNWPWHGSDRLSRVIKGIQNTPSSSKRSKRPAVSFQALETLAIHLDPRSSFDIAVLACACTAFWGQCRLGELLPVSNQSFDPSLFPRKRSLRYSPGNKDTWILNLPSTKTDRHGQDVTLVKQAGRSNPLKALHNHLQANRNPYHMPLFTFTIDGAPVAMTKKLFLKRCNEVWSQTDFPTLTGHSFRIGGTTHLLLSGVPPDVVKVMGRWSSDAFLQYWRSSEHIAPIYAMEVAITRVNTNTTKTRHHAG